jgi:DNA polymerase I-like protein with 3'-5' exonuclease and polymerase domains
LKNYIIVTDSEKLAQLENHINSFSFFAFDTETTGLNVRKDKVIGFSISGKVGTAFYVPLLTWSKTFHCLRPVYVDERKFYELLVKLSQKELLMWNGSYDIRIVKSNFGLDLAPSLLADIMLMKHTVEEEGEFRLKETAIELGQAIGLGDLETAANEEQLRLKQNVLDNGGIWLKENKEMYKADLDVMGPYACADADITLRCANYYKEKLEQEGLEEFFYDKEVMPLYKYVTIKMEEKGVCLDLAKIEATRIELVKDMAQLEKSILGQLEKLPEVAEWRKAKAFKNYPSKNTGAFAQAVCEHYKLDLPKTPAGKYSLTEKNIKALRPFHATGFLLGNSELPVEVAELISINLLTASGEDKINILSKKQMGEIVFNFMGISPLSSTAKGAPQFDDDLIQHLADEHKFSWAVDLSNYNKLSKILGTYIDRFLEEQEDGKFYPSFFQHRTISGRYGSDLQQLPRVKEEGELDEIVLKYVNEVRTFFISGFGRAFVDDDYESLEPHTFAHVSGDEGLRDIFRKGHDFYSTIAIATEKLFHFSADKKAENYLGKLAKPKRQSAKAYCLGVPYGMKAFALGKTLDVSTKEAEKLIEGYLNGFPALKSWMEESEWQAKNLGYVRSETGRIRHLPRVKELYRIHGDQLLNFMYRKRLESRMPKEVVQSWYRDYKNGLNNAKNFQIQSLSASIVNMAAIAINKKFDELSIDAWVALQIHDQLVMNVPEERSAECAAIVQDIMENNYKLSIKLKAPAAVGHNLKEAH